MALLDVLADAGGSATLRVSIHLSHADIVAVCRATTLAAALADLILSTSPAPAVATVIPAVARRTAWRLPNKDKRFGHRGVKIVFTLATDSLSTNRRIAHAVRTTRIREPDARPSPAASRWPSASHLPRPVSRAA